MNPKAKKVVKKALFTIAAILIALVSLLLTSPLWLGPAAKTAANSIVTAKAGTKFEIKNMSLNIFSGKFSVEGTRLSNPEGYKPADAAKVGKIFVDLDMASLFSDILHFREISVDGIFASYVSNNGTNNFEWISNHIAKNSAAEEEEEKEEEEASKTKKKVIIDRLAVSNSKVQLEFIPLPLPNITLTDIGKKSNGATIAEACGEIMIAVKNSLASAGGAFGELIGAFGSGLGASAGEASKKLGETGKAIGNAAGDAVNAAGKKIDKAGKAVTEGASQLFKKAGGLLGNE